MVPYFAGPISIRAFPEHDPEIVAGQKAPTLGINWILAKAKDVHVIPR